MPPGNFPRTARLLRSADFDRLRSNGRRIGTQNLSAQIAPNTSATARLGFAVSRRYSKSAVRRNRFKRLGRESFRHALAHLPAVDIVLIPRATADQQDNASLRAELERLWQRIAALNAVGPAGTMRD